MSFNNTNGTFNNLTGNDYCVNNEILAEGLCGEWIDNNLGTNSWNNSAFVLEVNCSASNRGNQSFTCVQGACRPYYDDFSSGVLDPSKWIVSPVDNLYTYLDEQYVNSTEEAFHTAQLTPRNGGVSLTFPNQFVPGEVVEYDVNYVSGSGNRVHTIGINNGSNNWALFGFWNTIPDGGVGNDLGWWHVKITFTSQGALPEITKPDGTIAYVNSSNRLLGSPSSSYTFGAVTRTGHNGAVHMDYDNFLIY